MKSSKAKRKHKPQANPSGGMLRAQSVVEGLFAPGIGAPATNAVLSIYYQLQQSEWYEPSVLVEQQWRQLRALIEAAAQTPYYAPILAKLGLVVGTPFTKEMWHDIPILSRQTLQQSSHDLINASLDKIYGGLTIKRTSGASGPPVEVQHPQILSMYTDAAVLREQMWHQRDLNGRFAYLRSFASQPAAQALPGLRAPGWSGLETVVATEGESFALDSNVSVDDQRSWLKRIDPHYITTYPTNLRDLLDSDDLDGQDLRLPSLREVRTVGEPVDLDLRILLKDKLGVPLVDVYSAQEVGHIAFQCPDAPVHHVLSEFVKLEILRADDSACDIAESGRIVVTHLQNLGMPLIRYDLGDIAEFGEPCSCGRGLPVINHIRRGDLNLHS